MASYGWERSCLLIFSARDDLVKVSWNLMEVPKPIYLTLTSWVKGASPFKNFSPWLISGFGWTTSFVKSFTVVHDDHELLITICLYSSAWFLKTVTQHIGYHFHVFLLLFKPLQLLLKIFFFSLPAHFFSLFVPDSLFQLGGEECVNWSLHKQTKNPYNLLIVKSVIAY